MNKLNVGSWIEHIYDVNKAGIITEIQGDKAEVQDGSGIYWVAPLDKLRSIPVGTDFKNNPRTYVATAAGLAALSGVIEDYGIRPGDVFEHVSTQFILGQSWAIFRYANDGLHENMLPIGGLKYMDRIWGV